MTQLKGKRTRLNQKVRITHTARSLSNTHVSLQCFRTLTPPTANGRPSKTPSFDCRIRFLYPVLTSRAYVPYPTRPIISQLFDLVPNTKTSLLCFRTPTTLTANNESSSRSIALSARFANVVGRKHNSRSRKEPCC